MQSESLALRVFHGPGDWVAGIPARTRRSTAFWLLATYGVTIPLRFPYKNAVSLVWALSELAILISLLAVVAAETPEGE